AQDPVQRVLPDFSANLQAVSDPRLASTTHHSELPAQIRQVLRRRRLPGLLRHAARAGGATAKYVAQDLTKDVAARCLRTRLSTWRGYLDGAPLPARNRNLNRSAPDDHGLDASFLNALLHLCKIWPRRSPPGTGSTPELVGVGSGSRPGAGTCRGLGDSPEGSRIARPKIWPRTSPSSPPAPDDGD